MLSWVLHIPQAIDAYQFISSASSRARTYILLVEVPKVGHFPHVCGLRLIPCPRAPLAQGQDCAGQLGNDAALCLLQASATVVEWRSTPWASESGMGSGPRWVIANLR
jgi:hypothetical protein